MPDFLFEDAVQVFCTRVTCIVTTIKIKVTMSLLWRRNDVFCTKKRNTKRGNRLLSFFRLIEHDEVGDSCCDLICDSDDQASFQSDFSCITFVHEKYVYM